MRPRIAFATCDAYRSLCDDDRRLLPAFDVAGLDVEARVWRDDVEWSRFDGVLLRSTWDYYLDLPAFLGWLDGLARAGVPCWNDVALVRWNADKRYLRDLAAQGVPTVPTLWFEAGPGTTPASVAARVADAGWDEVVLKPTVSADAWRTRRVRREALAGAMGAIAEVLAAADLMVQPFLPEILADGELSFVFVDGAFSHAVRKRPRPGDFRVQWTHGGRETPEDPSAALVAQARAVLAAAPSPGLYARVDGVVRDGHLLLMELEQVEPFLYLAPCAEAPARVARAVRARL